MKPVQDTFTSHIQGLYDGHEVAPPQGMKDSVFNQLDSEASGVSGLTSKAVLVAAVVIVGFAWFLMPETDVVVEPEIVVEQVVVADEVVVVADEAVVADEVVVVEEAVVVEETVVVDEAVEVVTAKTESVVVEENIVLSEDILSEEGATLPVVASPPVETVQKDIEEQKTIDKVEEKKEAVEWVLPAKLKVDE